MLDSKLIRVRVSPYSESNNSICVLVEHSNNYKNFSRREWFPKKICSLEKEEPKDRSKELPKYWLTCPKWLLDKKNVDYTESVSNNWKIAILEQIKEASKLNSIKSNLKNLCSNLLEFTDDEFHLVYSGSRSEYRDILYKKELSKSTLKFVLLNYGSEIYKRLKNNKRLF